MSHIQEQLKNNKIAFVNKLEAEWTEGMPAAAVRYSVICPCVAVNNIKIKCTELQVCLMFRMGVTLGLPN
jgi:hypothetical protein